MRAPKTVSIAGQRIKLKLVPFSGDAPDFGLYFHDKKIIEIYNSAKDSASLSEISLKARTSVQRVRMLLTLGKSHTAKRKRRK